MDWNTVKGITNSRQPRHVKALAVELLAAWEREDVLLAELARLREPQSTGILVLIYPDGWVEVKGQRQPTKVFELPNEGDDDAGQWLKGKWKIVNDICKTIAVGQVDKTPMEDRINRACACAIAESLVELKEKRDAK